MRVASEGEGAADAAAACEGRGTYLRLDDVDDGLHRRLGLGAIGQRQQPIALSQRGGGLAAAADGAQVEATQDARHHLRARTWRRLKVNGGAPPAGLERGMVLWRRV